VIGGGTSDAGREISLTVTGFALAIGAGAAPGAAPPPDVVMPGMSAGMTAGCEVVAEALDWLAAPRTSDGRGEDHRDGDDRQEEIAVPLAGRIERGPRPWLQASFIHAVTLLVVK